VVDLSSSVDEEGLILDTSWDEEFTRRLFSDHNRNILGPPSDGKPSSSVTPMKKKNEVCEETTVDADVAPSSDVMSPAPTASIIDADEDPKGMQD
jgi:hypothetical protein